MRRDSKLYNLTLDVNDLKQQIRDLVVRKSLLDTRKLYTRLDSDGSILKTMRQFFQVTSMPIEPGNHTQRDFMYAITDPDFKIGTTEFGLDMFFVQRMRYKALFNQERPATMASAAIVMSDATSCVVRCTLQFHGRVSRKTIEAIFPAALSNEWLVAKLVGRVIEYPMDLLFYFTDQLVTRLDIDADIVAGFSALLDHNPFDLACLVSNAAIAEESLLGDLESVEQTVVELVGDDGDCGEGTEASSSSSSSRHSLHYILS